jgi:PAS domain S-box-containing protein
VLVLLTISPMLTADHSEDLFTDGGRVGELMRSHDWSQSPLGPPSGWPQSLRSVVGLLLRSRFPMFVAWGKDLGFLYNDPYAEILGAKHPTAIGRRFYDIWSEIWSDISPLIDAAMTGQATYREDLPLLMNRKGYEEQTWFTFSYSPVRDEAGKVAGMFCACSETTQRVLAERALRDSEGRLRELNETLERRVAAALAERKLLADIVEGTGAFVQVADLEYRWLAVNRAAADEFVRIFGVRRPKVGDSMLDLLADQPKHQAAVRAVWSRALAGEEFTETGEFGDPSRDRRAYEMRFNTLRDREGRQIGAYQFVYDVTERVRSQERLRAAEEALLQAQKMESLGQLTGGVAHDFNNLLAIFASALQLMERTGQPASPRILEAMRRAVARGTGLTRHLLAFSRRSPINPESIDPAAHLAGMRTMLDGALGGHIGIQMRFGAGLWPVEVDPGELELAMVNLCVNARDAMPTGGVITISAENVGAESGPVEGDFVRIAVADTGVGMPPEVQARVFEPFFTTKGISKGSGLGLPQVYGFTQQSGGRVIIDSAVGVGTTVTLLLPRSLKAPLAAPGPWNSTVTPASKLFPARRGQVLLVEDDPEVAALTRELLTTLGFSVIRVASAEAALGALADARTIEVVLSDVMMPGGMSGLQLAREIRRRYPRLAILLTTGYVESLAAMQDGEFGILLKPYTAESLAAALGIESRSEAHVP